MIRDNWFKTSPDASPRECRENLLELDTNWLLFVASISVSVIKETFEVCRFVTHRGGDMRGFPHASLSRCCHRTRFQHLRRAHARTHTSAGPLARARTHS